MISDTTTSYRIVLLRQAAVCCGPQPLLASTGPLTWLDMKLNLPETFHSFSASACAMIFWGLTQTRGGILVLLCFHSQTQMGCQVTISSYCESHNLPGLLSTLWSQTSNHWSSPLLRHTAASFPVLFLFAAHLLQSRPNSSCLWNDPLFLSV